MKAKDSRMNHTTEALTNIKTLKLYSWNTAFQKEIKIRRKKELKLLWRISFWLAIIISSLYFFP
jgi:hypothetical protein